MKSEPDVERSAPPYEPPRVESVLTAEELAREIHYAGTNPSGGGG